ncbi:MAG: glutamate synthase large subunit, partial [Hyphomonadaceae bacterium]
HLRGSAGQSRGAFRARGLALHVVGDATDYGGKGLSGGLIALSPAPELRAAARFNAIIGNTCLYGATSGRLFAAGLAGERFAVRNSGAEAVIEGCGANGCEYLTGGRVVILGPVGENFGAGMTGGMAFVYDPEARFDRMANPETILWRRLGAAYWEGELKALITAHVAHTGSVLGAELLQGWAQARDHFWQIVPKEMLARLTHALEDAPEGASAAVAAE